MSPGCFPRLRCKSKNTVPKPSSVRFVRRNSDAQPLCGSSTAGTPKGITFCFPPSRVFLWLPLALLPGFTITRSQEGQGKAALCHLVQTGSCTKPLSICLKVRVREIFLSVEFQVILGLLLPPGGGD